MEDFAANIKPEKNNFLSKYCSRLFLNKCTGITAIHLMLVQRYHSLRKSDLKPVKVVTVTHPCTVTWLAFTIAAVN